MKWTKEYTYRVLTSNSQFKELKNEWDGDFNLYYVINSNTVFISNSIVGLAQSYIVSLFNKDSISDARDDVIAKEIL